MRLSHVIQRTLKIKIMDPCWSGWQCSNMFSFTLCVMLCCNLDSLCFGGLKYKMRAKYKSVYICVCQRSSQTFLAHSFLSEGSIQLKFCRQEDFDSLAVHGLWPWAWRLIGSFKYLEFISAFWFVLLSLWDANKDVWETFFLFFFFFACPQKLKARDQIKVKRSHLLLC